MGFICAEFLNDGLTIEGTVYRLGSVARFPDEGKTGALLRLPEAEQIRRWGRPMFREITEEDYTAVKDGTVPRVEEGWTPPRKRPVMPARPVANEEAGDLSPEAPAVGPRTLQVPPSAPKPEANVTATPPAPTQVGLSATGGSPAPVAAPAALAAPPTAEPTDPLAAAVVATRAAAEAAGQDPDAAEAALRKALAPKKKRAPRKAAAAPVEGQESIPVPGASQEAAEAAQALTEEIAAALTPEEEAILAAAQGEVPAPAVTTLAQPPEDWTPGITDTSREPAPDSTTVVPSEPTLPYERYNEDSTSATLDVLAKLDRDGLQNFLVYEYAHRNRPAIISAIESGLD